MQPFYRLDGGTRYILLQLIEKCMDLNLENINFCYAHEEVFFQLTDEEKHWELVVKQGSKETKDVYWIIDNDSILYKYSAVNE